MIINLVFMLLNFYVNELVIPSVDSGIDKINTLTLTKEHNQHPTIL